MSAHPVWLVFITRKPNDKRLSRTVSSSCFPICWNSNWNQTLVSSTSGKPRFAARLVSWSTLTQFSESRTRTFCHVANHFHITSPGFTIKEQVQRVQCESRSGQQVNKSRLGVCGTPFGLFGAQDTAIRFR